MTFRFSAGFSIKNCLQLAIVFFVSLLLFGRKDFAQFLKQNRPKVVVLGSSADEGIGAWYVSVLPALEFAPSAFKVSFDDVSVMDHYSHHGYWISDYIPALVYKKRTKLKMNESCSMTMEPPQSGEDWDSTRLRIARLTQAQRIRKNKCKVILVQSWGKVRQRITSTRGIERIGNALVCPKSLSKRPVYFWRRGDIMKIESVKNRRVKLDRVLQDISDIENQIGMTPILITQGDRPENVSESDFFNGSLNKALCHAKVSVYTVSSTSGGFQWLTDALNEVFGPNYVPESRILTPLFYKVLILAFCICLLSLSKDIRFSSFRQPKT